ncbi:MAG: hypothetical protein ACK559_19535 [bacterium]
MVSLTSGSPAGLSSVGSGMSGGSAAAVAGSSHGGNLETLAGCPGGKRRRLLVADDRFGGRVPADRPAQAGRDRREVAGVQGDRMADHVGNRQPALAEATVEVLLVPLRRLAAKQGFFPTPLPADIRSSSTAEEPTPGELIESMVPSGYAFSLNSALMKEYLGILLGR